MADEDSDKDAVAADKPPGKLDVGLDLLAFGWAVVCVSLFDWQAKDLIWGLWASSLCVGYAWIGTASAPNRRMLELEFWSAAACHRTP